MFRAALFAFTMLTAFSAPAFASGVTAKQTVQRVVETIDEDGRKVVAYAPADRVAPGDEIVYTLEYANQGDNMAEDIRLTMPVPAEVSYVERSALIEGMTVAFSADGGETFTERGALTVSVEGEPREAIAQDITHIRWSLDEALSPGEEGAVSFRAVLK